MSSLQVGIIGLPNAGKTTVFNALSRTCAAVASYPFTTVEPNVGVVPVTDGRLDRVADLAGCSRRVPATVRFVDIAGLVEGASKGEGLGNRFLANIREVDAVVHVVRGFDSGGVSHVSGSVDPVRDAGLIETELRLADLDVLGRMIEKARREAKGGDRECRDRLEAICAMEEIVGGEGDAGRDTALERLERLAPGSGFLSLKPALVVLNVGEDPDEAARREGEMRGWVSSRGFPLLLANAEVEAELAELDPDEAAEFEVEMGIAEESLPRIVRGCYELLDLITFFSIDSGECRAWPVRNGSRASHAAGRIHTDFEKGFIKAEVVHYEDFLSCGSFPAARETGHMRVEGRDYIVQDGDVIHFKI